jgi:hypothetical protein
LASAFVCAAVILFDIFVGHRQKMGVMEWVGPITALYTTVFGLGPRRFPFWVRVGVSASYCGGGCTLGDVIAETLILATGRTLFGAAIRASFVLVRSPSPSAARSSAPPSGRRPRCRSARRCAGRRRHPRSR